MFRAKDLKFVHLAIQGVDIICFDKYAVTNYLELIYQLKDWIMHS